MGFYIPENWEDGLITGTDVFGQANAELKQRVKESRRILKELEEELG